MRKLDARQLAREKSLFRYSSALERADFNTVATILQEAEHDPLLAQMIAEINTVYKSETFGLSPSLNHSSNHQQKDYLMTTLVLPLPNRQRNTQWWLPITLAAACVSVLFIGALMLRPIHPNTSFEAGMQVQSSATPSQAASATLISSAMPTSTPFPAAGVEPTLVSPNVNSDNAILSVQQAYDLYSQEKFEEAVRAYLQIVQLQPENLEALYGYGRVLVELDRADEAANVAQQILKMSPQNMSGFTLQALAQLKQNDTKSALATALKGYEIDPSYTPLLIVMAQTYTKLGQFAEAIAYGQAAVKADSSSSDAHHAYAVALTMAGKRDEAIQEFESAIRFNPNAPSIYYELALQFKASSRMDDALATYRKLLTLQPDNTTAMISLCETYSQIGDNQTAQTYCNQAIDTDPTYAKAYQVRGGVLFRQRDYLKAVEDFKQCTALGSQDAECYYQRGLASFYLGDCDDAWNTLQQSLIVKNKPEEPVMNIIASGLQLVKDNCPKYKDVAIAALATPSAVSIEASTLQPSVVPTLVPPDVQTSAQPVTAAGNSTCNSKDAVIISPSNNSVVAGTVDVTGIATAPDFGSYKLELIGIGTGSQYLTLVDGTQAVVATGTLGQVNLSSLPPDNYGLRLSVFDGAQQVQGRCLVNITLARAAVPNAEISANTSDTVIPINSFPVDAIVSTDSLTYSRPAANGALGITLMTGSVVHVDKQAEFGKWSHVVLDGGKNGWVLSNVLQFQTTNPQAAVAIEQKGTVIWLSTLREQPTDSAKAIGTVERDTVVTVNNTSVDGFWRHVILADGTQGWLWTTEVQLESDFLLQRASAVCSGTIGTQPSPLYSQPVFSTNGVALGILKAGTRVSILDVDNQSGSEIWYYVQSFDDSAVQGWVQASYFTDTNECPQAAANSFTVVAPTAVPANADPLEIVTPVAIQPAFSSTGTPVCTGAITVDGTTMHVTNQLDKPATIFAAPLTSNSNAAVVGELPAKSEATLLYQQYDQQSAPLGALWYLIMTSGEGEKQITGWVSANSLTTATDISCAVGATAASIATPMDITQSQAVSVDLAPLVNITTPAQGTCHISNRMDKAVTMYAATLTSDSNASVVGVFPAGSWATVILVNYDQQSAPVGALWYLIKVDGEKQVIGWVSANSIGTSDACGVQASVDMAVQTLVPQTDAGGMSIVGSTDAVTTSPGICNVINRQSESVPVYSGPSRDRSESVLVNNLTPNTPTSVLYQQRDKQTDELWYLVLAVMEQDKQISGWVSADSVTAMDSCPTLP